jgi:hypothetical protein
VDRSAARKGSRRSVQATRDRRALLHRAEIVAGRIDAGIGLLEDELVLDAFRIANRAMAASARRRQAKQSGIEPAEVKPPAWRPFQLAFLLMSLAGIEDPSHPDRKYVDLLFFPTGGGKTEAYLGLAAFTLVLRRLGTPAWRPPALRCSCATRCGC